MPSAYSLPMLALVFDFDGTIVDTEPLHEVALRRALQAHGIPVREGMTIGRSDEDAIAQACREAGREPLAGAEVRTVFRDKVQAFVTSMEVERTIVYPGAVELFLEAAREMPVAICTAAVRDEVLPIIRWLGIEEAMSALVTADEVEHKKPAPDAYRLACERLRVEPSQSVALEDSPRGVQSARDAGLTVVALEHTTPRAHLERAHRIVPTTDGLSVGHLREVHAERFAQSS